MRSKGVYTVHTDPGAGSSWTCLTVPVDHLIVVHRVWRGDVDNRSTYLTGGDLDLYTATAIATIQSTPTIHKLSGPGSVTPVVATTHTALNPPTGNVNIMKLTGVLPSGVQWNAASHNEGITITNKVFATFALGNTPASVGIVWEEFGE